MHIAVFVLLFISILQAQSIKQLIEESIEKHPSLKTIEHRLSAMHESVEASQSFSNPDISFTINNIHIDDLSNRSIEPMQYEAVNLKQKFPWFGKLDALKTYRLAQKDVIMYSYDEAKVKLAEEIRVTSYTVKELEERITIVNKYRSVTNQNIKLYTSYASTQTKSHTSLMSTSLLLSKIKIRSKRYESILKRQKARLGYLIQGKVKILTETLDITAPKPLATYLSKLENNPNLRLKLSQENVAFANKMMQELNTNPDSYLKIGYYHRAQFENYASITVGFSYPLYGTEELNTEAARKEMLSAQSATLDYRSLLRSDIEILYTKLTEAFEIYKIIKDESLPQLEHMFELSQSNIQRGGDLFAYTSLLEQKLLLEEELISIKAEYLRTEAKLTSLMGAL